MIVRYSTFPGSRLKLGSLTYVTSLQMIDSHGNAGVQYIETE